SNDENEQGSQSTIANIKSYVAASTSFLGASRSMEASGAVGSQLSSQYQNHDVAGTLVITAGCTHKDAVLLAPFILDPDKAIRVWNALFPNDMIKLDSVASLTKIANDANTKEDGGFKILSEPQWDRA